MFGRGLTEKRGASKQTDPFRAGIEEFRRAITRFDILCYFAYDEDMNVSLTPELDSFVQEKVQSGMYGSASEVLRAALRLLKEHDQIQQARLEEVRTGVRRGLEQLERGQFTEYASLEEMADSLKTEFRQRQEAEAKPGQAAA
jgi:antitoxin ParD1/3/4